VVVAVAVAVAVVVAVVVFVVVTVVVVSVPQLIRNRLKTTMTARIKNRLFLTSSSCILFYLCSLKNKF
jgi:hypothetical protein